MRKVGNMRVGSSKSQVTKLTEEQQAGLKEYREMIELRYTEAKKGVIDWEGEVNPSEDKKDKNDKGENILYCAMCHQQGDIPKNTWYPMFFTYEKDKAIQSVKLVKEMNKYLQQKYYMKVAGMRESDFKAGFNGAYTSKEDPEEEIEEEEIKTDINKINESKIEEEEVK